VTAKEPTKVTTNESIKGQPSLPNTQVVTASGNTNTPSVTLPAPPALPATTPPIVSASPVLVEKPLDDILKNPSTPIAKALPSVNTTPSWARATGSDRHGRWADLVIGTATIHFRLLPASAVTIGSPEHEPGRNYDETQHRATIANAYWVSDTECTQLLWRTIMSNNPSSTQDDDLPVDQVSYQHVQSFISRLRASRPDAPVRLPSEVEWEAACRAGTLGPYTGGMELRSLAWYRTTASDRLAPVARKQPNAYGLFDVHGNVAEWCHDVDRTYPRDPNGNPISNHAFIYRGGNFADAAIDCRAASRNGNQTGDGLIGVGFRLVITADMR
jgi:hypothetical protein